MSNLVLDDKNIELNNISNNSSVQTAIEDEDPNKVSIMSSEILIEAEEVVENGDKGSEEVECTALVELKPHSLLVAQSMFKKSIKISIKSLLISLSLGFLNLFF